MRFVSFRDALLRVRHVSSRLWSGAEGVAAVEFGLLTPVLLLGLLGTIEISRAVDIDRHFAIATSMTGDLAAREQYLGQTDSEAVANLAGMMQSIKHVMSPYDATLLKLGVFSVMACPTDASKTKVQWSYAYNGMSVPDKGANYTLPTGIVGKGGSVIVVVSSYLFKPLFADYVPGITGDTTWTDKTINSPRNGCVDYTKGINCISPYCN